MNHNKTLRKPTVLESLTPILFLIVTLGTNVLFAFKDDGLSGSNQIILMLSTAIAALMASRLGMQWKDILKGMQQTLYTAIPSILILLAIGALSGAWLISGIVPTMIYYGLKILNPTIFLFATCIVCAVVSLATGSSWSAIATIGVALLGIGKTLGMSEGLVAGAIISGAYFGDKMSPLSDTTNLAPAVSGADLFVHIRYMTLTTFPSMSLALITFLVLGFTTDSAQQSTNVNQVLNALEESFHITPLLFIVPIVVVFLIVKKTPALPALLIGILLGGIFAIIFQAQVIDTITSGGSFTLRAYKAVMTSFYGEISLTTTNNMVNKLLTSSGMEGMLTVVWLIICAMIFGGVMESSGMLYAITDMIIKWAKSTGSLIASTAGSCLFFNITTSDQYLAIVIPGRMYAQTYRNRGLAPENLSRTLEDSATVTSVLVPWNTCGAAQAGVLKVDTMMYASYCFFNIFSLLTTIVYAYFNIKISKITSEQTEQLIDEVVE